MKRANLIILALGLSTLSTNSAFALDTQELDLVIDDLVNYRMQIREQFETQPKLFQKETNIRLFEPLASYVCESERKVENNESFLVSSTYYPQNKGSSYLVTAKIAKKDFPSSADLASVRQALATAKKEETFEILGFASVVSRNSKQEPILVIELSAKSYLMISSRQGGQKDELIGFASGLPLREILQKSTDLSVTN